MCLVTSLLDWPGKQPQNEKNSGEKNQVKKIQVKKNQVKKNQVKKIWVNGHLGENLQVEKKSGEW